MSALDMLRAAIERLAKASADSAAFKEASRKVGEGFVRGAEENPRMFTQGRTFAPRESLGSQFGTMPYEELGVGSPGAYSSFDYRIRLPKVGSDPQELLGNIFYGTPHFIGYDDSRHAMSAVATGKIPRDAKIHVMDTGGLSQKSGGGAKLYAHAFGRLADDPEAVNVSTGLSGLNMHRRSLNMASALERDPRLANRLIVNPAQLRDTPLGPTEFHDLSPLEQIGALQLAAGKRTLRALDKAANEPVDPLANEVDRYMQEMRQRGMVSGLGRAFTDPGPRDVDRLADLFNKTRLSYDHSLGPKTIRKALLADDLVQGKPFEDLYEQFGGLEFRRGGRV